MVIAQPDRVVAHGVVATRVDGQRWRFASLAPSPQTAPGGAALISIIEAGALALAQLSVQLDPPASDLEALRVLLGGDDETRAPVTLESAVSEVIGIQIIADPDGEAHVLGTSKGSGFPPYTAVFSLQLTGADRDVVKSTLSGDERRVEVRYTVEIDGTETAISADLAAWVRGTLPA